MTRNIVDIIKEQQVNDQPTPTEKAQIVVMYTYGATNIFRFNSVKKGEKEYKSLLAAWKQYSSGVQHHDVDGDMFVGRIDLAHVVSICFVDHAKRAKFTPIQG
jgi:hypothetical protein